VTQETNNSSDNDNDNDSESDNDDGQQCHGSKQALEWRQEVNETCGYFDLTAQVRLPLP